MNKYCKIPGKSYFIYILFNCVTAVLSVTVAVIIQAVIDAASAKKWDSFQSVILFAAIFIPVYFIFNYLRSYCTQKISDDYIQNLRNKLYEKITGYAYGDFVKKPASDYLSLLTNDIHIYQEGLLKSKLCIIQNSISLTVVLITLCLLNLKVTLLIAAMTAVIYFIPQIVNRRITGAQKKTTVALSELTGYSQNHLEGFYVLSTYGCQQGSLSQFKAVNKLYNQCRLFLDKLISRSETLSAALSVTAELLILFAAAGAVFKGQMSVGTMVAIMQLTGSFIQPLILIMQNIPKISGGKAVEQRFLSVLSYESLRHKDSLTEAMHFEKDIQLNGVSFAYNETANILSNISYTIQKGKKYALIGGSGSGKTTLINIINGIYSSYTGRITVDGKNIKEYAEQSYMHLFATVGQNVFLFNTTIQDNIILMGEMDRERFSYACEISGVNEILPAFTDGVKTPIHDNGLNLSGGQKQKIALARAIYHQKPVLIVDEGTSAIDKESAYDIESRLLNIKELTLIAITHDIHSPLLRQYDETLCIQKGRIVQSDTAG